MRHLLFGLGAVALALAVTGSATAAGQHYGHNHGGPVYGGYQPVPSYYGGFPGGYSGHSYHPPVGHFDVVPGHYQRHGNHYHYVPPHVDYHHRGHRHEVLPGPFPGTWSISPYRHYRH